VYSPTPDNKDSGMENFGEIRVSNFLIKKINGERLDGKIHEKGFSPFVSRPAPESHFFIPPGNYTFEVSFFAIKFHYHGQRREIDTYTSKETVPLSFSIKENELVSICYKSVGTDSNVSSVLPEARIYNHPDDFKPPVYVPYASTLNFLPTDCYGGEGKTSKRVSKSDPVQIFKSVESVNKDNIITNE
jgi:hypothetical protein